MFLSTQFSNKAVIIFTIFYNQLVLKRFISYMCIYIKKMLLLLFYKLEFVCQNIAVKVQ